MRCPPKPPVGCALVVYLRYSSFEVHAPVAPPPTRQGSSSGDRAGVPLCAGDPPDSSRKPPQLLAAASQNASPSSRRHAVWWCVELGSTFSVREQKGGSAGPLAEPAGSPAPLTRCSRTGAAWHLVLLPEVPGVLATPHRASPVSRGDSRAASPRCTWRAAGRGRADDSQSLLQYHDLNRV